MSIFKVIRISDKTLRGVTLQPMINSFVKAGFKNKIITTIQ